MPLRGPRLVELGRTVLNLRHGRRLRAAIETVRPDLVHLNERGMLQAAVIARRSGAAVVMHARSVADPRPAWLVRVSRRAIARNVDRVIAIDGSVRRSLGTMAAAEVVHNPLAAVPAPTVGVEGAGPSAGASGGIRVVYLTGLAPAKGIWDLVAAAERLGHRTDIEFVIAGANGRPPAFHRSLNGRLARLTGLVPDVESDLRRRVAASGLEGTMRLVGHLEDPGPLIRSSDVLVFPSHHDGPGRSVIEAAIEGVPSVVALRHRIEDVVVDGESGVIVPPRDPAALAAAIERLADDPALRSRLGAAARTGAATRSDPTVVARRVVEIYRDVLVSRGTGSGRRPTRSSGSRSRP
jgi:glycosyltransferase involved in cell wall biosynthesis